MTREPLSLREARRLALMAQGLLGPRLTGGPTAMLRRLRAVQIDTISSSPGRTSSWLMPASVR